MRELSISIVREVTTLYDVQVPDDFDASEDIETLGNRLLNLDVPEGISYRVLDTYLSDGHAWFDGHHVTLHAHNRVFLAAFVDYVARLKV
jgi:hypothetical protein